LNSKSSPVDVLRFGVFELDLAVGELRKNSRRILLQPQPFRILKLLASQPGMLVTREEVRRELWDGAVSVDFEQGMNFCIRRIRLALGDDAESPRYIETVRGRGYRFLAPVTEIPYSGNAALEPTAPCPPSPHNPTLSASADVAGFTRKPEHASPAKSRLRVWSTVLGACVVVGVIVILVLLQFPWRKAPPLAIEQRITWNPPEAPVSAAVVSPDGRYVAYADSTGIYLRHLDSGETRPLPLRGDIEAVPTSWFPDSLHLLLSSLDSSSTAGLWKVSMLGGTPQKLVDGALGGVISPDGATLAFLRGQSQGNWTIWVAGSDGRQPRPLLQIPDLEVTPGRLTPKRPYVESAVPHLAWSPNSLRIAYVHGVWATAPSPVENTDYALDTVDLHGRSQSLERSRQLMPALFWAADGRLLYAHHDDASQRDRSGVWSVRVNENSGKPEGGARQLTRGEGRIGGLNVTADGRRLVLWRMNTRPQVFLGEMDPITRHIKTPHRLTLDESGNVASAWNPDSSSILFVSNRSGTWKLLQQRIDQVTPEVLIEDGNIFLPRFEPDGTHILYLSGYDPEDPAKPISVMEVPVQGGAPRQVLQRPSIFNIQCARSPASLCLLSTRTASQQDFFSFRPENGSMQHFGTFQTPHDLNWSLSPDGLHLALISVGSTPGLTFLNVKDKSTHEVTLNEWTALHGGDWAADGKAVVLAATAQNGDCVILAVTAQGDRRLLLEGGRSERYWWALPSPDGRYAAVEELTGENNVWTIENF
jgi:DNA-binding winged helix-turn-helix (wHTH) protein/Tol biopolymer transport system component